MSRGHVPRRRVLVYVVLVLMFFGVILYLHQAQKHSEYSTPLYKSTVAETLRLRIILIDTDNTHKSIRSIVGSIHHHHGGSVKTVIYGLGLSQTKQNEIRLWENIDYVDVTLEFVVATRKDTTQPKYDVGLWRPLIIKHATEEHGEVLYVDSGYIFTADLHSSSILKSLSSSGYFFGGEDCLKTPIVQGYVHNSQAYHDVLVPSVECNKRHCSNVQSPSLQCQTVDILRRQDNDDTKEQCYLIMRENFITSFKQLSPRVKSQSNGKTAIALGFPTTSKGNNKPTITNISLFTVLVPSFLSTIDQTDVHYTYVLYLVYDQGDLFFNDVENQNKIVSKFNEMADGYPAKLVLLESVDSNGWTTLLWNIAFQHAIDDGADYFYQLNDDTRLETRGWTDTFVQALRNNPFKSNFGVTGPKDRAVPERTLLTQAFVSKTHYEIFGYLYPYIFKNWYADNWITEIYNLENSMLRETHRTIQVKNSQTFGTRYEKCFQTGESDLKRALEKGRKRIIEYLS